MKVSLRWYLLLVVMLGSFATAFAAQCLGTTREGKQCRNQAQAGASYCHYHNPAAKHCAAKTKDGSPCRNSAQPGSEYCHVHKR